MNRRNFVAAAATTALSGCGYPRQFTLEWMEEVALSDGSTVELGLKYFYDRRDKYSEYTNAILRDTELTFDAGGDAGRINQRFVRVRPMLLDKLYGDWYAVLQGRSRLAPSQGGQDWGVPNIVDQYGAVLRGRKFIPLPIGQLPIEMRSANILMDYAPVDVLKDFNGKKVTLQDKKDYLVKYPLVGVDYNIAGPAYKHQGK